MYNIIGMAKKQERHYAVLVIDMVPDFFTGPMKFERSKDILPNVIKLVDKARAKGIPIIFSCDGHYKGIDHEFGLWGEHAILGSPGATPLEELHFNPDTDYMINKRRYSAFFRTDLDLLLDELHVDTIIMVGVHTHICVQHTACDAYCIGYNIIVASDGTTAFTQEDHDQAIKFIRNFYAATIAPVDEIIKTF